MQAETGRSTLAIARCKRYAPLEIRFISLRSLVGIPCAPHLRVHIHCRAGRHSSVTIQIAAEAARSTPCWLTEVAAFTQVVSHTGILKELQEQVRFARFG